MDSIAKTSLLTAAMRALETNRSDSEGRLFSDPYAKDLAGEEGEALLQKGLETSGPQPAIAIRTYFIDTKISEAVQDGVSQIVMLAAGMDTRAYRIDFPKGLVIFELDRPEVFKYKSEIMKAAVLKCERKEISVDLRTDWTKALAAAGFDPSKKTLWMVEGLIMYLEEADVMGLYHRINLLAAKSDRMLFDVLSRTMFEAPHMVKQLEFLKSIGAPWKFGENEPEQFMEKFGWTAKVWQTGEFVPSRWPFPVAPRSVPNLPRGFLVEAFKN